MVKPGAAVVDVGINRDAAGKLVGDVDFAAVREVAGWISPVPGGVGPMTITMLLDNTVLAAERAAPRTTAERSSMTARTTRTRSSNDGRPAPLRRGRGRARGAGGRRPCSAAADRGDRRARGGPGRHDRGRRSSSRSKPRPSASAVSGSAVSHLSAVVDTPSLRAAYNACLPKVTEFWTAPVAERSAVREVPRDRGVARVRDLSLPRRRRVATRCATSGSAAPNCRPTRRRASPRSRTSSRSCRRRSPNTCSMPPTRSRSTCPTRRRSTACRTTRSPPRGRVPRQAGVPGYRVTLHMPSYLAVMQFANDRALRETRLRGVCQARVGVRRPGAGQRTADPPHPRRCAPKRRRCSTSPTTRACRWCRRWPSRPTTCCASSKTCACARGRSASAT